MGDKIQSAILDYVENGVTVEKEAISKLPGAWKILTEPLTVYHGQPSPPTNPSKWKFFFSASTSKKAAERFATRSGGVFGCLWTITLMPGIRVIDVASVLGDRYPERFRWEKEILVKEGDIMTGTQAPDACLFTAVYSERKRVPIYDVKGPTVPKEIVVDGGKRRHTKRWKMPRKMSRKYCKKTPCRKMGFTQRASCRPYKNCFTQN